MELNVPADYVPVAVSMPPKVAVSTYMGTIKEKIANKAVQELSDVEKKPYWGKHF
jgi:putative transposase